MNKRIINKLLFIVSLICIFMIWAVMHIYNLGHIPRGLHIDEAGMAYDAFCISNWGVDRYLNPYPLYFYNYGGGMSAAYVYLCAFFIKILGTRTAVFRIPALIFSLITGVSIFFIVKKAFGKGWAVLAAFLYTALPYFTTQSRFGLDCNLMLGAATLATWVFIEALERDKWYWYVLDGVLWGLVLYTYIISYMVLPIFLLITCVYLLIIKKIDLKKLLYAAIPFVIMAIPLIIMSIITFFQMDPIVTPFFTIPCITGERMTEFSLDIITNIKKLFFSVFISDGIDYNSLYGFFTLYLISLPFCAIGAVSCLIDVVKNIKQRKISISFIIFCYCFSQLIIGSLKTNSNINNMNGIYFTVLFFIVSGIRALYLIVGKCTAYICEKFSIKILKLSSYLKHILLVAVVIMYMMNLYKFAHFYFKTYPYMTPYLFTPRLAIVLDSQTERFSDQSIYLDSYYTHYILEKELDPHTLGLKLYNDPVSYENITFRTVYTPLPDDLTQYDVYIIQDTNYEYRDILMTSGLNYEQVDSYFIFYQ